MIITGGDSTTSLSTIAKSVKIPRFTNGVTVSAAAEEKEEDVSKWPMTAACVGSQSAVRGGSWPQGQWLNRTMFNVNKG